VRSSTTMQSGYAALPQGPLAPDRVILSRSIITYPAPSDPLAGTAAISLLCSLYAMSFAVRFRLGNPTTGFRAFHRSFFLSMFAPLRTPGESSGCIHPVSFAAQTLAFVPLAQTRHSQYPHKSVFQRGMSISELHYGSLAATTC